MADSGCEGLRALRNVRRLSAALHVKRCVVRRSVGPALCGVLLAAVAVAHAAQGPGQPPRDPNGPAQPGAGRIRGRVVAADTAEPLGRAQVTLAGPAIQPPRRALADPEGRYEFTDLPPGRYTVTASRTGYVDLQFGQRRPFEPGTPVVLAAGQPLDRIDIALPRGAVITARITDDLGSPLAGVEVRAQRFRYGDDGQRTLTTIFRPGPSATDDRGEIRLFGLMPGEYVVSAVSRDIGSPAGASPAAEGYAPTYYPGVISPGQAAVVPIRLGEETAVQFSMVRSRLARVSGVVTDAQGRPANGARVSLATSMPGVSPGAMVAPDGRFELANVVPGDYALVVTYDGIEETAATLVVDGNDVSDLRVAVTPGTTVTGRVVFEGGTPPAAAGSPLRIVLASVQPAVSPGLVSGRRVTTPGEDGRFGMTGVSGRIVVDVTSPDGWGLKSVTIDGQDVTNVPLDLGRRATLADVVVTVTNRLTSISGQALDASGQAVRDYTVVAVPLEPYEPVIANRRVRVLRPGLDGRFATRGMMPGRYVAVAVEALEDGRQFSPEFHQQVRRLGLEFGLREGENTSLTLRMTPGL